MATGRARTGGSHGGERAKAPRVVAKRRQEGTTAVKNFESATSTARSLRLPRTSKGRRARFFEEPGIDQLFGIVTALTAELSVALERIETLERVLEAGGTLERAQIEQWAPGAEEAAARAAAR